jgi:hypothetical protein
MEEAFTPDADGGDGSHDRKVPGIPGTEKTADPFEVTPEEWEKMSPIDRMIYQDVKRRQRDGGKDSES